MRPPVRHWVVVGCWGLLMLSAVSLSASEVDKAQQQVTTSHAKSKQSQQKIDKVDEQIRSAHAEYVVNERRADTTEAYNRQLAKLIESQGRELEDLQRQLASLAQTDRAVLPMLNQMVSSLRKFVAADLPFLAKERQDRLAKLDQLLLRADVSTAEKYRQILEAFQVEVQYGRTMEAYPGFLETSDKVMRVTYLRLGRTALYYQTLNGQQGGLWQPAEGQWQAISESQNLDLRSAIHVAQQMKVPDILRLPLPRLEAES